MSGVAPDPLDGGDYWDTIEAALTSLPESNRLRAPALASFDHLKERVTNGDHAALVEVARAAREWWFGKRPIDWTSQQHAEQPHINCVGLQEQELAAALARLEEPA